VDPANRKQIYVTTEHDGLWWTGNLTAAQPAFRRVETFPFRQPVTSVRATPEHCS